MIRRQGIDVLAVERMDRAIRRSGRRFLARTFTPAELAYCQGRPDRLAGRWTAKEAVIKCFDRTPICFPRSRIEVLPSDTGAPEVRLLGEDARGAEVQVSITHQGGIAIAGAWLEMPDADELPLPAPEAVRLPERPAGGHKGTFGTVVAVAGSRGFTGAAYLTATAAARSGAGLVRLLVAEGIYLILAVKCTEVMATPVAEDEPGAIGSMALNAVLEHLGAASAGVIGPGLGREPATWRLVQETVTRATCPLVLDADALNALAEARHLLPVLGERRVLTPHPGEMARLTGRLTSEVQADRRQVAGLAAREWGAVVVLKGARTVVAAPDGRVSEDPHQVPALASGGTGDVLAGLIAGLMAQGSDAYTAAVTGVYVHAEAGRRLQARQGSAGLLASELLPAIPIVMKAIREANG
ncbi:MAG TPA: NAD(P)H-hydrate dehydratase [Candidatus Dormibacteraeota bacterium]|nr:NAD(P)H-hydrate dehydratase [Candidatus Dormibacteraeota bacterium]